MKRNLLACALVITLGACSNASGQETTAYQLEPYEQNIFEPIVLPTPEITLRSMIASAFESTPEITPAPTAKPTTKPVKKNKFYKTAYGKASTYGPGYAGFLALPEGPGILVEVCGPAGCIIRRSNDAGPNLAMQRAGRIIDLNVSDFETICGCNWRIAGIIKEVRVRYIRE